MTGLLASDKGTPRMIPGSSRDLFGRSRLSAPGTSSVDDEATRIRMESFRKVKPICVSLMGLAAQRPTSHSQHTSLLIELNDMICTLPKPAFTSSLINYLLFPITNILRQSSPSELPDNFLEAMFRLLSTVVTIWRRTETGIEIPAWEQLWKFAVSAVIPRLRLELGKNKGKGKERDIDQEVLVQAVNLLVALLDPTIPNAKVEDYPTAPMRSLFSTTKSHLLPTLFQTISILIETSSPFPPNLQLQLWSLRLLRPLITTYLAGRHELLASILPGLISSCSKLIHSEAKRLNSDVGVGVAALIGHIVVATLNDEDLRRLGVLRSVVDDLSDLADWDNGKDDSPNPEMKPPPSPSPSNASMSTTAPDPFPPLSASYLAFTSTQLQGAIIPILSVLSTHTSSTVREASASLANDLIVNCNQSLPLLLPQCLATLLELSVDEFDSVRQCAKSVLRILLQTTLTEITLDAVLVDLLSNAINSLPRLIVSQQEPKVEELALLITAIAETTSDMSSFLGDRRNPIADLLGPSGNVERWGWSLLNCLEFGRPSGWSASGNTAARAALKGWEQGLISNGIIVEDSDPSLSDQNYPTVQLRYLESEKTSRVIRTMLVTLGSAGGDTALHSVEHFVLYAKNNRRGQVSSSVSALWVSQTLLQGIADAQESGMEGRVDKKTRKMAREITRIIVSIDEEDDDDDDSGDDEKGNKRDHDDSLLPMERYTGINAITTLLDKNPLPNSRASQQTRQLHIQAQKSLLTCIALSTLSLTSRILSTSFRPLLLNTLYTVLSHLASPQQMIQQYANITLTNMAYNTGYASPQNMVFDNVDYVINVVSQRLTYSRLSSQAPLVLISMIKLVGPEIVPLVHDVVDEIFDALDDFHGYEILASTLLAVLVTLIEIMASEIKAEGLSEARIKKLQEFRRIDKPPNPEDDMVNLYKWYSDRPARNQEIIEGVLERAPQHAWGQEKSKPKETEQDSADAQANDEERPPTRSQQICIQILSKSINFLTHSSPFLRSKILSLISHAIPVLANGNRESDLLPLIDKSWSIIINRLDDEFPYVMVEAITVIASLSEYVGDFMSRRILDQAWPKFKRLLKVQADLDRQSALSRRKGVLGSESSYTISHRFYLNVLKTCTNVVREVPVDDKILWEMMVGFRGLLDTRVHEELQELAMMLYTSLGERDGDALWVVLSASIGEGDERNVWGYLADGSLDILQNARILLETY